MDYEKKYNEALERAKTLYENANGMIIRKWVEQVFPELKESEDERIRKRIYDYINVTLDDNESEEKEKWLDWLEKQGEHKHQYKSRPRYVGEAELLGANKQGEQKPNPYSGTSFEYDGHTWGMCARDNCVELLLDGELKAFLSLEKSFIYPIHPQPELAPKSAIEAANEEKVDNANKVEPKDYNDIDPHFGKPTDKVEPKFKQGEWIIFNGLILYVDEVVQGYYRTISIDGIPNSYDWDIDNAARLWSIADAKDGDVLALSYASKNYILIYKRLYEKGVNIIMSVCCFYCVEENEYYDETDNFHVMNSGEIITPATNEQCALLFQKMKEAGYAFDFDKKELKKIEQKPVPKFEVDDVMRTLQEAADNITSGLPVVVSIDDEYYHCTNELIAIKDQNDYEYPPMNRTQKPTWSEEDESKIRHLIAFLDTNPNSVIYSRPKEEWINWLKSLRPRSQWKPSEEQIYELTKAVDYYTSHGFPNKILDELLKQLYNLL